MTASIGRQYEATAAALAAWQTQQRASDQTMSPDAWARLIDQDAAQRGGPDRPYKQLAAVFRCVNFIAGSIAALPFNISTADDRLLESGPLIELVDNPNPKMSGDDFWLHTAGWSLLTGRVHWVFTALNGQQPSEILPVGGLQTKPVVNRKTGELIAWKYRPAGAAQSEEIVLSPDEVWTLDVPSFDPDHPHEGVGVIDVVRRAINQVWKADSANEHSLDNDVEPGGALETDHNLTPDQRRDLREQVNEKHAGHRNRRRFMLLEGGLKFERTQATFQEMEFSVLRGVSVSEICAAFGLDKAAIGYPPDGGRFEYVKSAKASAWIDRNLPFAEWLAGHFDKGVIPRFRGRGREYRQIAAEREARQQATLRQRCCPGYLAAAHQPSRRRRQLFAWFDSSHVPAVKETIASRVETAGKMVSDLKATPQDAIELFDIGLEIHDWQKVGWQKATEMPIGDTLPGEEDLPAPDDGPEAETATPAPSTRADDPPPTAQAPGERPAERQRLADAQRASWHGLAKSAEGRLRRQVQKWRRHTLKNLEQAVPARGFGAPGDDAGRVTLQWHEIGSRGTGWRRQTFALPPAVTRDVIDEILFDLVAGEHNVLEVTGPLLRESIRLGGQQTMDEVAAITGQEEAATFNIRDDEAQAALRRRRVAIKGVPRRARERLRARLSEGVQAGESHDELAERIKHQFNIESRRTRLIAQQEISSAVEESREVGRQQANVPLKSWLWSHAEEGRPSHAATEQATMADPIPNDQDFQIAGTTITCPRPKATGLPEHDINCGCTAVSRFPNDAVKDAEDAARRILAFGVTTPETLARRDAAEPQRKDADHAADPD